ncbi:hypothetical protein [Cryobacterium sp. BB307]|nr:hypothetical protein [Cryobacterium sp. BB307]
MREQSRRYKRFEKARQRIAEARAQTRRREHERRINPPLFDLHEIEEDDR